MTLAARSALLLAVFAVCGCTLIDQNTFNPTAGKAPVIAPAPVVANPAPAGPLPLLVIAPSAGAAEFGPALRKAVASARARKPLVVFDVVEVMAPDTPPDAPMGGAALAVARVIVGEGVPPAQVRLDARPDATSPAHQVRVFVR